jgi:transcriptional regulator with XRE-family HTH domain
MEIQELGQRIKRVRKARSMTLKEVEATSKVSATHISEIERGKTSPTVGALSRIAQALGKDTSFFLESRNLDEVSRIRFEERERKELATTVGSYQALTQGIPGGHLQVCKVHLDAGSTLTFTNNRSAGEISLLCESGKLAFVSGEAEYEISGGDSLHFTEAEHQVLSCLGPESVDLILVSTRRHLIENL